jgi:MEMO1 family protein
VDKTVRPSALAGTWYEGSAAGLTAQVRALLEAAEPRVAGEVLGMIEPHAGYRYSGAAAAAGYRLLAGRSYRRVLVLAPSHHAGFHGFSVAAATHFATPLGEVALDVAVLEALRSSAFHRSVPRAHEPEHSIEIQLPFLQAVLPGAPVVPVLVGHLEREDFPKLAEELRPFAGADTLVVASSDFTHQGPRFDFVPFERDLPRNIRRLDFGGIERLQGLDPDGFLDYVEQTGATICGFRPIALMLHLLGKDVQGHVVSYYTSGDVLDDWESSVSYATLVFQRPDPHPPVQEELLPAEARRVALRLAREAVAAHLQARGPHLPERLPAELREAGSCFVTLRDGPDLRGCIGRMQAAGPLLESILANAVSAATEDPRFLPVRPDELEALSFEISVLTPAKPVAGPEEIELGRHGVVLERWGRRAVFLPQVAVDQLWTREEMLDHLARKAGFGPGAWRRETSFSVFGCQVFSESDPDQAARRDCTR